MDSSSAAVVWYRRAKPLGKVRRRVQDLRIPSPHHRDLAAVRPALDLSHNESARLAVDCLLSRGLDGYREVLDAEGEVDFLSEAEKKYVLENGRDGNAAADPGDRGDDGGAELESSSAGSHSGVPVTAVSTGSEPTVTDLGQSSGKDVKWTDPVPDESSVVVYFQADGRGAGMKDTVREFFRKAKMTLAIVMDSFSDVELLCDLLEASRKRNVSVHLLLDHLNLSLFVSVWRDLKLDSRDFPKLSVRSIDGQTYCSKTGRKLTGQIAESFIIVDWTEVLTGSYSFSWLSWQVHRSLAVLLKGSTVTPFHQEFHRLYSSSKPVPGFVTFITLPPHVASHAAPSDRTAAGQRKSSREDAQETPKRAEMPVLSDPPSPELQLHPAPVVHPNTPRGASQTPKPTADGACAQRDARACADPRETDQIQVQRVSGQTHISQSQLTGLTTAEKRAKLPDLDSLHPPTPYQSSMKKNVNLEFSSLGTEGAPDQQRNTNRPTAGLGSQRGQWTYSLNFKQQVEPQSEPSTAQLHHTKTGLQLLFEPFASSRGNTSGFQTKVSSLGTRGPVHPHQSRPAHPEAAGSKPTPTSAGTPFKLNSQHAAQPAPRLNWMLQSHAARPRPVVRTSSFDTTYGTGRRAGGGQPGWRPAHGNMTVSLERSKSLTDRHKAGFRGAGFTPNMTNA